MPARHACAGALKYSARLPCPIGQPWSGEETAERRDGVEEGGDGCGEGKDKAEGREIIGGIDAVIIEQTRDNAVAEVYAVAQRRHVCDGTCRP